MVVETITYKDFNGNERTEDFYFNLTEAEVTELELSCSGGLTAMIDRICTAQNEPEIIKVFKDLIRKSYGVKSPDGRKFIKNESVFEDFEATNAYSILFMQLATDADKAAKFFNAVIPQKKEDTDNKETTNAPGVNK